MFNIRFILEIVLFLAQGIFEILNSAPSMDTLEERTQCLIQEAGGRLMVEALAQADKKLGGERDPLLKAVGFRSRTLITCFGEITIRRRLYRHQKTNESHFLLDEALKLPPRKRSTERITNLMLELGTEMPFRRAARTLGLLLPGVHAMTIWANVQQAGKRALKEQKEQRQALFQDGVAAQGSELTEELSIEADGVIIPLQRSSKRHQEIKLMVGYEGKDKKTHALLNRHSVATIANGNEAWEIASAAFANKWDLSRVKEIRIGGDGAQWVKLGLGLFPGASYHLDPFHIRKRLTEALGQSPKLHQAVSQGLRELDQAAVTTSLERAAKAAKGSQRTRIRQLKSYLLSNWDGIAQLPEEQRLGAIEGQVRHTIARRMKRIGARWSPHGAEGMSCLLAAKANRNLTSYAMETDVSETKVLRAAVGARAIDIPEGLRQDPQSWLRANCPALVGPHAGRTWVKALREMCW